MGTGLMVSSALMGHQQQVDNVKKNNEAIMQKAGQVIQSYNYNVSNMLTQRHDEFVNTIDSLQKMKQQGNRNLAAVQAALGESIGGEGRTGRAIANSLAVDTNAALNITRENYERTRVNIGENIMQANVGVRNELAGLQSNMQKTPSILPTLVGIGASYVAGKTQALQIKSMREAANVMNGTTQSNGGLNAGYQPDFTGLLPSYGFKNSEGNYRFDIQNPYMRTKSYF